MAKHNDWFTKPPPVNPTFSQSSQYRHKPVTPQQNTPAPINNHDGSGGWWPSERSSRTPK